MFASLNAQIRERVDGVALIVVGVVFTLWCLRAFIGEHIQAQDFHYEYWPAGWRVLHGESPYVWSIHQTAPAIAFAYPALSGLLFVPFAFLSRTSADAVFTAVCIASPLLALLVLGVRDRRVYGVALMWAPTVTAWQSANLTLPLTLGMAFLWRYRDRPAVAGVLTAILISLKPVVFPLALWLLITRRFAAVGWGLLAGAAINLVAWSVVGFNLIGSYLHETKSITALFHSIGYSVQSIALRGGLGDLSGPLVVAFCAVIFVLMLRCRRDDSSSLALTVVMMLAASPLVWNQYFVYMLIPTAAAFPRLNRIWLAPIALLLCTPHGTRWWEPWLFWIVTVYVTQQIISRSGATVRVPPRAALDREPVAAP